MADKAAVITGNLKMTEEIRALATAENPDIRTARMMAGSRHRADRMVTGNVMTEGMNIRVSRNTVDSRPIRVTVRRTTRRRQINRTAKVIRIMQVDFRDSRLIRGRGRIRRRYTA